VYKVEVNDWHHAPTALPSVPIGWNGREVTERIYRQLHRRPAQKSTPGFSYCPLRSLEVTISTELLRLTCKYMEKRFARGGDYKKEWLQLVSPKRRYISTKLHNFTFQKTITFVATTVNVLTASEQSCRTSRYSLNSR
jgi:hypothetical protein